MEPNTPAVVIPDRQESVITSNPQIVVEDENKTVNGESKSASRSSSQNSMDRLKQLTNRLITLSSVRAA